MPRPADSPILARMSLYFGCPIWAFRGWVGNLFTADARPQDYLSQYARVFNAVEANSTFYALPKPEIVERWRDDVPEGFRFCFKMPRAISHEARLVGAEAETKRFLERMGPLGERLGPFFLQLGPSFDRRGFSALEAYLRGLPRAFAFTVELRHPDWFDQGPNEARLAALLQELDMSRVLFDSRPLFSAPPGDATTAAAQGRKPRVPVRRDPHGPHPFVRFIGSNDPRASSGYLGQWAAELEAWLDAGREAFFFTHAPDDTFAPRHARVLLHLMHKRRPQRVPPMPAWPGERRIEPPQLGLGFDRPGSGN